MLLLVSKWKCLLLMFLLSFLRSMQSLSLPPFFPTVFKASTQAAGSLILQIMPSAVTFYSSATGLFSPQKMSQHLWQMLHLPTDSPVSLCPKVIHSHEHASQLVAWWPPAWLLCLTENWHVTASSCSSWWFSLVHVSVGLGLASWQVHMLSPSAFQFSASLACFHCRNSVVNFTCIPEYHLHALCRQTLSIFCICLCFAFVAFSFSLVLLWETFLHRLSPWTLTVTHVFPLLAFFSGGFANQQTFSISMPAATSVALFLVWC